MAKRQRKKAVVPRPEMNLTSMMDLVLNLVALFTVLTSVAAASLPPLQVPQPTHSLAQPWANGNKLFISLLADPGDPRMLGQVVVGETTLFAGDTAQVAGMLQQELKISPTVEVYLRADQRLKYSEIQPYMLLVANSGVKNIHYVALPRE
jgi:biopolymer transport protein ExbD